MTHHIATRPAVILLSVAISLLAGSISAAQAAAPVRATERVRVTPLAEDGSLAPGYVVGETMDVHPETPCWQYFAPTYRCMNADSHMYDWCWYEGANDEGWSFACLLRLWDTKVIRFESDRYPIDDEVSSPPKDDSFAAPSAIRLTNGLGCQVHGGTHNMVNGRVITWGCSGRYGVLSGIDRSRRQWKATLVHADRNWRYRVVGQRGIRTAYAAKASPAV